MYFFTRKGGIEVQFVMFPTKHGSAGVPFHPQPEIYWIFTQTELSSTYRRKFLCLMKHHVLLAIQGKLKHPKFYYFSVAMDSGAIQASVW